MTITHSRVQHAVGQGSFHSGSIEVRTEKRVHYRYDYVYDCGALAGGKASPALRKSIRRLDLMPRQDSGGQQVIDAVVLSHYDCDHIIGAEILASQFQVRRIIVPFLSPLELMLVLASQADALSAEQINALHGLATGGDNGELFDIPVTQVQPGPHDESSNNIYDELREQTESTDLHTLDTPGSMRVVADNSNLPVGSTLLTGEAVSVAVPGILMPPWRFKFWNRGISDVLMEYLFLELWNCGFPLHALDEVNGATELVDWLKSAQNRTSTLEAYKQAITKYRPAWAREASGIRLANFLSLGMYSGPAFEFDAYQKYFATIGDVKHRWGSGFPCYGRAGPCVPSERTGWLGTGDAPLGEPDVWVDFNACYRKELGRSLTVQVPHHGAAPKTGPKFFNPGLLPEWGMFAVVSAGARNHYGHPTSQVIKEVLATHASLEIVTEESGLGFQEVFNFYL